MLTNYFKIAFRNLWKNKAFSFINIAGLAVGMASAMLILLWIQNEVSHDRFHTKIDRIYTLNNRDKFNGDVWAWSWTPKILGPTVKQEYPDVEDAVRTNNGTFLLSVGDKHLNAEGYFTDTGFLNMFSFPLVNGNASTALNSIDKIVITQELAKKLFGNENAMGKIIRLDSSDNFTVSGVLKDLPNNTKFDFEYLLPWSYMHKINYDDSSWGNNSVQTYVLLKIMFHKKHSMQKLNTSPLIIQKIQEIHQQHRYSRKNLLINGCIQNQKTGNMLAAESKQ